MICEAAQTVLTDRLLLDLLSDKWSMLLMSKLCGGERQPMRFNAMKRAVPGISQKSLAACLRRLERNGLVKRTVVPGRVVGVEYAFTPLGHTLSGPIEAIYSWTLENAAAVRRAQAKFDRNVDATG